MERENKIIYSILTNITYINILLYVLHANKSRNRATKEIKLIGKCYVNCTVEKKKGIIYV